MSGSSYRDSGRGAARYESLRSDTKSSRDEAWRSHREAVEIAEKKIVRGEAVKPPAVNRDESQVLDRSLAQNTITRPSDKAKRAVVVLVDNSASNSVIATKLKQSSGYFTAFLRTVDPGAEVAFIYFSDHDDEDSKGNPTVFQYTNFIAPNERGDKILFSSLANVVPAHGGDEPEAIECALSRAANIDFGHVTKENRTIILITDSVAHGMGCPGDDGCPVQKDWRMSMAEVRDAYGRFVMIGSGANVYMRKYQKRFFEVEGVASETEIARNFIDLSDINNAVHRNGIVGNAILFAMARNAGKQAVQIFLASLYTKWLENPIFGQETKAFAKARIRFFGEMYLGDTMTPEEVKTLLTDIFAE